MVEVILLKDYEEDITKYAKGLEKGKILKVYRNISCFLSIVIIIFYINNLKVES